MSETESFLTYSTRGRTLMSLYNFDTSSLMSEWDLAEAVSLGLPAELKVLVDNFGELLKVPFDYNDFEQRVALFYKGLPKKTVQRPRQPPSASSTVGKPANQPTSKEETIWRIHAYLDSQGRCHFCKKTCGYPAGTCPGPLDRSYIEIPASFSPPPKPSDYKAPKARGGPPPTGAGKPTHPPAGRAPARSASVAAVAEDNCFPELDQASVAALAALDEELRLQSNERYVAPRNVSRLIIQLVVNGESLR
jgi:hypothetical protein